MEIIYEDQQRGRVRPGRRVWNEWRQGIPRKGDLSGESEEGRPRGESGIDGGWGVRGRETSAESQEWVEAGESEEESPQRRVRRVRNGRRLGSLNGWRLESQEWVEAGESEEGSPQRRVMNGWRLESRRKGDLSGESGIGGGGGVGGMETSA
ncbi:hypothetical protein NDU88_001120 [Pleurodeles waltl]|uniref:Uncharacterized protein n=1 Tax=Pleurodeles waltl TaxID=8319 RepID=A0AAV7KQM1_PLEWA|nr:hypothetical protein NDU88_001120 [Pleurodeles waltl]